MDRAKFLIECEINGDDVKGRIEQDLDGVTTFTACVVLADCVARILHDLKGDDESKVNCFKDFLFSAMIDYDS